MKKDTRLFKAREINSYSSDWIADLSGATVVNPDCYFWFKTKKQAVAFLKLYDGGMNVRDAINRVATTKGE